MRDHVVKHNGDRRRGVDIPRPLTPESPPMRQPDVERLRDLLQLVWTSSLFERGLQDLLRAAYAERALIDADEDLRLMEEIQRSLLPTELPKIPSLDLAAYYQPAGRTGGDYYDFFELARGKWGILIADVCGHGGAATLGMAITRALAHSFDNPSATPNTMLEYLNEHLTPRCRRHCWSVTAFFGIYDPDTHELGYASAGHPPPRLKRCCDGRIFSLDGPRGLPLGILRSERFAVSTRFLRAGDQIAFYTNGVAEACNQDKRMFGSQCLERTLRHCRDEAEDPMQAMVSDLNAFTDGRPPVDDRTLILARVGA